MTSRRALILLPALLTLLLLLPAAASAEPVAFFDTAGTVHEEAVAALVDEGIVQGCDDDSFCARDGLTRAQAATMLVRAFDLPSGATAPFSDVADNRHSESIGALADAGFIAGCGDGRYCPQDPVTREQLATMIHRTAAVPDAAEEVTYFEDLGGVHRPAVRALAKAGIASGCSTRLTSFCAGENVERAHAAMFLARTLNLVERVELAPFDERKQAQDEVDAERAAAAAEKAEAEAKARAAAEAARPANKAVEVAVAQLGKPYRWAGSGPNSFDCSGLTSYAWAKAGVQLPRSSRAQYAGTTRISRSDLQPGDLVFYHSPISHVAMYIGDGQVVESPNSGNNVRIRKDGLTRRGIVGYGRP